MGLKHQASARRKMFAALRRVKTHLPDGLPALLFLTDPVRTPDPARLVPHLPPSACTVFRHFGLPELREYAWELAKICASYDKMLLIAADPDLAQTVGAHGVHWPERRLGEARKWRGAFALQTAGAHSRRAIWRAEQAGMDAALVSPIFPSNSPSAGRLLGPIRLRQLARGARLPIYALGGVNHGNAGAIAMSTGIAAIEGVEALYAAP